MKLTAKQGEPNEKYIVETILHYLSTFPRSLTCKIELSGRPVKSPRGTILIPFKSPFHRKGMSDILHWQFGSSYAFEVKTPKELRWWNNYKLEIIQTPMQQISCKKRRHFKEQYEFLFEHARAGGIGDFVDSVEMVKNIIETKKSSIYIQ